MSGARKQLGREAEDLVADGFTGDGWRLVERNARTRHGEIDLIAFRRGCLAFVEVKASRQGTLAGPVHPLHAVGPEKRARIRRLAAAWLAENRSPAGCREYRFDVVGVTFDGEGAVVDYQHLPSAF